MSRSPRQSQDEMKVRKWVRKILEEDENRFKVVLTEADLMSTFVTPFTDVFNAAKVGSKMILSAAVLNLQMFFSFSEKSRTKAWGDYNKRKTAIDAEWKEAMANTEAYWDGEKGDMGLIAFMVNPASAIGISFGASAVEAGKGTAEFAAEVGIVPGTLAGLFSSEVAGKDPGEERGAIGSAIQGLASLFFVAHHEPEGPLLAEAGEEDKDKDEKKKKEDPVEELKKLFEESGAQEKMNADVQKLIDDRKAATESIVEQVKTQFEIVTALGEASDLESFKEAIDKAKSTAPDIVEDAGLNKVEAQVEEDVNKILENPESREEMVAVLAEKEGIKPEKDETGEEKFPDIEDEKLIPEIEKSVFMKIKETLQEDLTEGAGKLKESAIEAIEFEGPSESDRAIMSKSSLGKEMIKVIEDGVSSIEALGG
jgi:hypothetical protein